MFQGQTRAEGLAHAGRPATHEDRPGLEPPWEAPSASLWVKVVMSDGVCVRMDSNGECVLSLQVCIKDAMDLVQSYIMTFITWQADGACVQ
jgi:hypothetical protein